MTFIRRFLAAGLTVALALVPAAPASTQPRVLDDLMMELNIALPGARRR